MIAGSAPGQAWVPRKPGRTGRPRASISPLALELLAAKGATIKQTAAALGIGRRTLQAALARDPALRDAMWRGRQREVECARAKLHERAQAGSVTALRAILARKGANIDWIQDAMRQHEARGFGEGTGSGEDVARGGG